MKIEGGREKVFSVDLKALPSGPTPEQVQRRKQGMSSFGAKAEPGGRRDRGLRARLPVLRHGAVDGRRRRQAGHRRRRRVPDLLQHRQPGADGQAAAGRGGAVLARGAQRPGRRHRDERPRHLLLRRRRRGQPGVQRRRHRQRLDALLALVGQVLPVGDAARNGVDADMFCTDPATRIDAVRRRGSEQQALQRPAPLLRHRLHRRHRSFHVVLLPDRGPAVRRSALLQAAAARSWTRTTARSSPRTITSSTAWPESR